MVQESRRFGTPQTGGSLLQGQKEGPPFPMCLEAPDLPNLGVRLPPTPPSPRLPCSSPAAEGVLGWHGTGCSPVLGPPSGGHLRLLLMVAQRSSKCRGLKGLHSILGCQRELQAGGSLSTSHLPANAPCVPLFGPGNLASPFTGCEGQGPDTLGLILHLG